MMSHCDKKADKGCMDGPEEDPGKPPHGDLRHAQAGASPIVPLMVCALQEHESSECRAFRVPHAL